MFLRVLLASATISVSGEVAQAAPVGKFIHLQAVSGLDSPDSDSGIAITADGLSAYFGSPQTRLNAGQDQAPFDLFAATRLSTDDPFSGQTELGSNVNLEDANNSSPHITPDGLRLYWSARSAVTEPRTRTDLYMATRESTAEQFSNRVALAELNTDRTEYSPTLTGDELTIVFDRGAREQGNRDLYIATRNSVSEPFDPPQPIAAVNTPAAEVHPSLSSDGLTLFYGRGVGVPNNSLDIWVATRNTTDEPFGNPMSLEDQFVGSLVNAPDTATWEPFISVDWPAPGAKLYFTRTTLADTSDWDAYEATWIPEPSVMTMAFGALLFGSIGQSRRKFKLQTAA